MKKAWSNMGYGEKFALIFLILIIVICLFGPWISPYSPEETFLIDRNLPPSFMGGKSAYLLGTDELGRDLLSRIIEAIRISMSMAFVGMLFGSLVGVTLGLTAGYFGGWWDKIVISLINFQQSIPFVFFILVIIVIFGRSVTVLLLAVGFANWDSYARYMRSVVLSIKEKQFIEAARSYNASSGRIIWKYIFPNATSMLLVLMTLNFPGVLLLESSLSFIGIGVQPPTATLGQMVGAGRNFLMTNAWLSILPSIVIVLLSFSVMRLGEWLQSQLHINFEEHQEVHHG